MEIAPKSPRTLGGLLFWRDVAMAQDWRVQVHVKNGSARLLDPEDRLALSSSVAACQAALHEMTRALPPRKSVVVIVHPMAGGRRWMNPTRGRLRQLGLVSESFGYASLMEDVPAHAEALSGIIGNWDDVTDVSFVTLSLGGPVVANMLAQAPAWRSRIKVRALVMMGPPAQGAALARIGVRLPGPRALLGPGLDTLAAAPMPTRGLMDIPILIIAGKIPIGNPLLSGDDDGVVRVSETRIDVPHTHMVVTATHAGLQRNKTAQSALTDFIVRHHSTA
jgi:pimeloyl-ACP methyl ester carboxylesterase